MDVLSRILPVIDNFERALKVPRRMPFPTMYTPLSKGMK